MKTFNLTCVHNQRYEAFLEIEAESIEDALEKAKSLASSDFDEGENFLSYEDIESISVMDEETDDELEWEPEAVEQPSLASRYARLKEICGELGKAIEEGDPQVISDTWLYLSTLIGGSNDETPSS